jgi:hypothetical protein
MSGTRAKQRCARTKPLCTVEHHLTFAQLFSALSETLHSQLRLVTK